jgi:hypothetical protein
MERMFPLQYRTPPPTGRQKIKKHFTKEADTKLRLLLRNHPPPTTHSEWEQVAHRLGEGFSGTQVRRRWQHLTFPIHSRLELSIAERRELLKATIEKCGSRGSRSLRFLSTREVDTVAGITKRLFTRLAQLGITLQHRDDVDALPDRFFIKGSQYSKKGIRDDFIQVLPTLPHRNQRHVFIVPQIGQPTTQNSMDSLNHS